MINKDRKKWERVWKVFQDAIPYDNSMGDFNYLIGRYICENAGYDENEFKAIIKSYVAEEDEEE